MSEPNYEVQHIRNVMIPMRDGVALAASLFMPVDDTSESSETFPAILEFLPYRKDDHTAPRWNTHYYFAERGYVGVRLDVRGTGASWGVATDEYALQEQHDGYDAIEWLAQQPWSNGKVGMWGTSYGGFNCIQVAMHRPPHLAAIAPHAATDDRYNDDVHFSGGCLSCLEQIQYPLMMVAMNALPPHSELSGADWEPIWKEHLGNPPWMLEWFRHQREDEYWANGSLKTDYAAIKCPVFMLGGWHDGYTNSIFRMLERMNVPLKALVGPWTHMRPDGGYAGPHIHYLDQLERWWEHWLKGIDSGFMNEPLLAMYVPRWYPAERFPETIPGEWRYEPEWPPARLQEQTLYLHDDGALHHASASESTQQAYEYDPTIGINAPTWCPTSPPQGLASDTRYDDVRSLTYDLEIEEALEILGQPKAILHVSSTAPVAQFTVKLIDVAPDGRSTFITRGTLNATRWNGMENAEPLIHGKIYELEISLRVISWRLDPGHRLRVSIASSDWPTLWPTPYPATNTLYFGPDQPTRLILPTVPAGESVVDYQPAFDPPVELSETATTEGGYGSYHTTWDESSGEIQVGILSGGSVRPGGLDVHEWSSGQVRATIHPARPADAQLTGSYEFHRESQDGKFDVKAMATIESTVDEFNVWINLAVDQDDKWVDGRTWNETFKRDLL